MSRFRSWSPSCGWSSDRAGERDRDAGQHRAGLVRHLAENLAGLLCAHADVTLTTSARAANRAIKRTLI